MLSVLIWLPIVAAIIIGFLPGKIIPASNIRLASLTVAFVVLLWNLFILFKFDISNSGMQFQEYLPWNETLGLSYQLGVDGLSLLMLVLNSLLTWIAIYSSSKDTERPRLFYSMILLVSGGVAGAFL
ncbi:MAG TPA: NAD(P)H-quinone oxidoreductase subunit D4, partial [Nostocaceae cyanobacterium]|nr:NAD(P)H-quinone oxidoreductase subunit D4 [Nostocaceae cyanobacterium]